MKDIKFLYLEKKLSYKEIAKEMGISRSSVYRRLKKAGIVGRSHEHEDLVGKVYGSLTVISYQGSGRYPEGGTYHLWQCQCQCGNVRVVRGGNLKQGQKSCKACATKKLANHLTSYPFPSKIWLRIVYRCDKKGLDLAITPDILWDIYNDQNGLCAVSGVPIFFGEKSLDETTASPDRIDQSKGYVKGNVRWVHKTVNSMRNTISDKELFYWCQKIYMKGVKNDSCRLNTSSNKFTHAGSKT